MLKKIGKLTDAHIERLVNGFTIRFSDDDFKSEKHIGKNINDVFKILEKKWGNGEREEQDEGKGGKNEK